MKTPVTFRIDRDLLDKARQSAQAENRTLTNFVETLLKIEVEERDKRSRNQRDRVSHQKDDPRRI